MSRFTRRELLKGAVAAAAAGALSRKGLLAAPAVAAKAETKAETYADDLAFLNKHSKVIELAGAGDALVAIVPAYQGRVMTSTLGGGAAVSFGWVNRKFIEAGKDDPQFNNYGGEDRFWMGPEAGQFGLWFSKGDSFDLAHWKTPKGFNAGEFPVSSQDKKSVTMAARFDVANYSGTAFKCEVKRVVSVLNAEQAAEHLKTPVPAGVKMVAYESSNTLGNAGEAPWTRQGGLLSIWVLAMYKPLAKGRVIVPFLAGDEKALGPKATTNYFGEIPAERIKLLDDHLLFSCDGKCRSKLGISPKRARNVLGSYDPQDKLLTIVQFNLPADAAKLPYVNSLWKMQEDPFGGDAVNSYNDGPNETGGQLGPFYEMETSSAAAELKKGESITHVHRTFHFAGDAAALNGIAEKVLGVSLKEAGE